MTPSAGPAHPSGGRAQPADVTIRPERPGEATAIRALTDAAFAPSGVEGRIVDALRLDDDAWLPELSLVAADSTGRIVGHCVTSLGFLDKPHGTIPARILALGPISVAPDRQRQGIGGALLRATIEEATTRGWPAIVLVGHADYYPRFGWEPARPLGIEPPGPWGDANWLVRRLSAWDDTLRGRMRFPSAFPID